MPAIKELNYSTEAILAGSGPGAGDAQLPDITDDPAGGPGAGDYGDTPGLGSAKFNNHSVWED